ncbi:MAG: hypothetical protein NC227_10670 [Bacteroides sp.]|nr:hypothetical protein [Bacteroides sp.]
MMNQSEKPRGMIRYTSRDYSSIMEEFWGLVPKLTELWKPESSADPGVVLGKFLASIADMLSVNLDWLANEIFGSSVSQRKNAEKLFGLIGYNLGWYTAARTEVTFTNNSSEGIDLNFGFNGSNFSTLNAYTDITSQQRVITYNILPMTNKYGEKDTRSKRVIISEGVNVFTDSDPVRLEPGESVTRVAIEGELRNWSVSVEDVKNNNYIIKLPSQHLDTTAVWIRAKNSKNSDVMTQWVQVDSPAEFIEPEPRFAVTYDNYSNAQIQVSNYLNELENYKDNTLIIYWIECSGVIGSVSADVLSNFQPALPDKNPKASDESLTISNLANTVELPHSYTVTGRSPETAKEAYFNSRKYINTWDSLITVPDFNRFLTREAGVDCGLIIDCQKALEINLAIYNDANLTKEEKEKMYITSTDFPLNTVDYFNWREIINLKDEDKDKPIPFTCNFKTYTAMCYVIHNDFSDSTDYAPTQYSDAALPKGTSAEFKNQVAYIQYKAPYTFLDAINADFRPLQAMSVELNFGYARIFPWYVVGQIYPRKMVSKDKASNIVAKVKEALALYFAPANRSFGQKPTIMEVVEVIENAHPEIRYFDAGSLTNPIINYGELREIGSSSTKVIQKFDITYFNPISFARYKDLGTDQNNIRVAPEWILSN